MRIDVMLNTEEGIKRYPAFKKNIDINTTDPNSIRNHELAALIM